MRGRDDLTDILVRQWMKEVKPTKKVEVTNVPQEGWQRTANGARCFQIAPIHNDEIGFRLSQLSLFEKLLPHQLVEKLVEKEYEFVTAQPKIKLQAKIDSVQVARATDWVGVEESVKKDNDRFCKAIAEYTKKEKWELVRKLGAFLSANPSSFQQMNWLPSGLLIKALSKSLLQNFVIAT